MAMRATWKGVIELGKQKVPVKLYSAVEDTAVHFHLLHGPDGVRVEQRLVNPNTGEALDKDSIVKGFQLEPGKFVVLKPNELKSLAPESAREIEVARVVPTTAIAPAWFERPYLLGPDGDSDAYLALARALGSQQRQAVVHWVMRGRSYTGALRAQGDRLVLIALRDREEVIEAPRVQVPKSRAPSDKEIALAEQLVSALEGEFDPSQFKNEYRERVRKYVEQKARGRQLRLVKPRERKPRTGSLEQILRASVKAGSKSPKHKERKSA
jgi:DNA end-binding protein Ku